MRCKYSYGCGTLLFRFIEEISELVLKAESIPHIAGRCSVFSKTDMIHHMQEGVPTEDLLLGLSYSLVRNYKANVLQNRNVKTPVLLLGGVMKNAGVVRAIKELFNLTERDMILRGSSVSLNRCRPRRGIQKSAF